MNIHTMMNIETFRKESVSDIFKETLRNFQENLWMFDLNIELLQHAWLNEGVRTICLS